MHRQKALEQYALRLRKLFAQLAAGQDVPPSQRLRLEGMMETLVLLQLTSPDELDTVLASIYREIFKVELTDDLGEDWRTFYSFPQIPGYQRRAPVFPTTPD